MSRRRPLLLVLAAVVMAILASGCQVRSEVAIRVEPDGSGVVVVSVRLDGEAARRLGDPSTVVSTQDLVAAGWTVDDPERSDDAVTLRARRSFASPEDLPAVLAEVGGRDGVFRDVQLSVRDGFASTEYDFSAAVELTGSPEQFGDDQLTAVLDGLPLARTPEELALEGAADPDAITLEVAVALPGGSPTTNGEVRDGAAVWSFPVSGGEPTSATLTSTSSTSSGSTRVLVLVGGIALLAAAVLAVVGVLRRRG